ncbi:hypothetical protein PG994_007220 [Apiospora phragmitis]|uniref:Shikimate dehydrogenase substrate binding N-terminal domain-containing protein n=1 Tax=Apiospora phragmitis TaxID=2905665 RepID=A0ABR1V0X9_9PEZI
MNGVDVEDRSRNAPEPQTQLDRHGYLFGLKIQASMSPLFHKTIYGELGLRWEQKLFESADIPSASVTMPNKVAIMKHLDELTEECREVGACNTIFLKQDPATGARRYCGTNTDVVGIRESFYQNVADPDARFHDRPALVVGGGGAARSAVYALHKWMRATRIYLVNRDPAEVAAVIAECTAHGYGGERLVYVATPEEAGRLEAPGAIVACVPDFAPRTPAEHAARAVVGAFLRMPRKGCMLEMCYNPTPYTALGGLAEAEGWQVILGTKALIWQGLEQDRFWTGVAVKDLPVRKVSEVIAARLSQISKL